MKLTDALLGEHALLYEMFGRRLGRAVVGTAAVLFMLAVASPLGAQTLETERMFDAVMKDDLAAVKRHVEAGAEIRWRNPRGLTAAEFAVELGHIEIANFLLTEEKPARPRAPPPTRARPKRRRNPHRRAPRARRA